VKSLPVPVIVKEIGAGISGEVARRLIEVGVSVIDVAGAGGTSWAGIEILRGRKKIGTKGNTATANTIHRSSAEMFWDWGIPTVEAITSVCRLKRETPSLKVIASGGIANGIDCAKSIALGADYAASARSVLKTIASGGTAAAVKLISQWEWELKNVMFLTGSCTLDELQNQQLYFKG
jgi:isopentenyl-diphosphate delta-isomerase